jgi:DNA-directed RNA polymerase subunit RPC12/RpoP
MIVYYHFIKVPEEKLCVDLLKAIKEEQGIICRRCNSSQYYWKQDKTVFECKECGVRTSLKVGTIMNRSRLPIYYWVVAVNCIISGSSKITIKDIQRKLEHKRYEPILEMCNTIKVQLERLKPEGKSGTSLVSMSEIPLSEQHFVSWFDVRKETDEKIDIILTRLYLEWLSKSPQIYKWF